jgi:hypothetical protein
MQNQASVAEELRKMKQTQLQQNDGLLKFTTEDG